tara:strand:- start:245 stop:409 length:165 start_codon:yes stop_codon:yes gene_type:complete
MTSELFIAGLVLLCIAALIIVALTSNKDQQTSRRNRGRSSGADAQVKKPDPKAV